MCAISCYIDGHDKQKIIFLILKAPFIETKKRVDYVQTFYPSFLSTFAWVKL